MDGLKIKTVTGDQFEVNGKVTFKDYADERIYYCGGRSWPEEIVTGFIVPDKIENAARAYREIQVKINSLEAEAESLKAVITAEMEARNTDIINAGMFVVRYTHYESNRVDTTALKAELPNIAARYTKTVEARRFQVV